MSSIVKKNLIAVITAEKVPDYFDSIKNELNESKLEVEHIKWNSAEYKNVFNKNIYRAVVILDAKNCPAFMSNEVYEFMKSGGNVAAIGGPAFTNEYYSINNNECDFDTIRSMMKNGQFDKTVLMLLSDKSDLIGFEKDTYNPDSKKYDGDATLTLCEGGAVSDSCIQYYTRDFSINESFEKEISIKEGHNAIGFYAKAFKETRTITIKLIQNNGDMFKTRITPSTTFEYFVLSKKDFVFAGSRDKSAKYEFSKRPVYVDFNAVVKIQFGHALSHAYSRAGEHSFYLNELSSASIPFLNDTKVVIDGLYPEYKFFPVNNAVKLSTYTNQSFIEKQEFEPPSSLFSMSPRHGGSGFNKHRRMRFVPLIEAYDSKKLRCGFAAYMLVNASYCNRKTDYNGSSVVAFTPIDKSFYENGGAAAFAQAVCAMLEPIVLLEGGSEEYIYFSDCENAVYGCRIWVRSSELIDNYKVKITVGDISSTYSLNEFEIEKSCAELDIRRISFSGKPVKGLVTVALIEASSGKIVDILSHEIVIYQTKPASERKFAQIKNGTNEVYINGKPVRFFGVNYMPSCNTGLENGEEFEHYVSSFAYDPDIIETDLKRIRDIGMNAVSIFMHYNPSISSYNILHLVHLCEKYGLYADLAIRPHANPYDFCENEVREMIKKYRFDENDTVTAYDIAWERYVGTYEPCYGNFNGRKSFDTQWRDFLINRYGSYVVAEQAFGCSLPRNSDNEVIGVTDDMLREDGSHTVMVAVYRRFIDEQVAKAHIKAMRFIKSVDPNHMISPRTGDASTVPLVDPGIYGYDYKALACSMEFTSPESYALSDDNNSMRQGVFTNIYSRYANKDAVVMWKEFGKSIWIGTNFADNSISEQFQAEYYRRFFDMLIAGHTAGLYAWWWAGGFRIGENSDFGIVAPDGSDRPVTRVFREYAERFLNAPALKNAEKQIYIDRDLHSSGLLSMYKDMENELFDYIAQGKTVEFVDGGSGKTSANVDLIDVGNTKTNFLPKYINGIICSIKAVTEKGVIELNDGDEVQNTTVNQISITVVNTEKSVWLANAVGVKSHDYSDISIEAYIGSDVTQNEYVDIVFDIHSKKGNIVFSLYAKDRTFFGQKVTIKLS